MKRERMRQAARALLLARYRHEKLNELSRAAFISLFVVGLSQHPFDRCQNSPLGKFPYRRSWPEPISH